MCTDRQGSFRLCRSRGSRVSRGMQVRSIHDVGQVLKQCRPATASTDRHADTTNPRKDARAQEHPLAGDLTVMTVDGTDDLIEDVFWKPHASPRSVWGFVATYPFLILAIYRRSRSLMATILCSVVVNLGVASPPEDDSAWATRVVLGEQVWLERGISSEPSSLGIVSIGALVQLYTFRAAVKRQPVRTAVGTVASMLLMFVFFDRMVRLYDERAVGDAAMPVRPFAAVPERAGSAESRDVGG